MRRPRAFQVDVFTKSKLSGNPAGVVMDADGLSEHEMSQIAWEFNKSETAFVLKKTGNDHDLRIRFFTPKCEVPIYGYATIGAIYARSLAENLPPGSIRMLCRGTPGGY